MSEPTTLPNTCTCALHTRARRTLVGEEGQFTSRMRRNSPQRRGPPKDGAVSPPHAHPPMLRTRRCTPFGLAPSVQMKYESSFSPDFPPELPPAKKTSPPAAAPPRHGEGEIEQWGQANSATMCQTCPPLPRIVLMSQSLRRKGRASRCSSQVLASLREGHRGEPAPR